jgi:hypothetical protein
MITKHMLHRLYDYLGESEVADRLAHRYNMTTTRTDSCGEVSDIRTCWERCGFTFKDFLHDFVSIVDHDQQKSTNLNDDNWQVFAENWGLTDKDYQAIMEFMSASGWEAPR